MSAADAPELLRVDGVSKVFAQRRGIGRHVELKAVTDASFSLKRGEVVALVGESGSGKSTLGRIAIRVIEPSAGEISLEGRRITHLGRKALRPLRRKMQLIFQDPYGSLNPRMRIGDTIAEGLQVHGLAERGDIKARVAEALERVGMSGDFAQRLPSALSGGQRQRIAIARALAVEPTVIVADEPTSALDVSVQAEIIDLLKSLQLQQQLSMLFISHDLRVVQDISNRVMVLYLGRIVESGPTRKVFAAPAHPYTRALLEAVPRHPGEAERGRSLLQGELPDPISPPEGCVFHPRCRYAIARCRQADMRLQEVTPEHATACIRADIGVGPDNGARP